MNPVKGISKLYLDCNCLVLWVFSWGLWFKAWQNEKYSWNHRQYLVHWFASSIVWHGLAWGAEAKSSDHNKAMFKLIAPQIVMHSHVFSGITFWEFMKLNFKTMLCSIDNHWINMKLDSRLYHIIMFDFGTHKNIKIISQQVQTQLRQRHKKWFSESMSTWDHWPSWPP